MTFMNRAALAALVAVSLAVPAAAQQSSITQADIQRLAHEVRQLAERRVDRVADGLDQRLAPGPGAGGHDQERPSPPVRAHRDREPHEDVVRVVRVQRGLGPQQIAEQLGGVFPG